MQDICISCLHCIHYNPTLKDSAVLVCVKLFFFGQSEVLSKGMQVSDTTISITTNWYFMFPYFSVAKKEKWIDSRYSPSN